MSPGRPIFQRTAILSSTLGVFIPELRELPTGTVRSDAGYQRIKVVEEDSPAQRNAHPQCGQYRQRRAHEGNVKGRRGPTWPGAVLL
jgi:hypothetical protein